jgi:hypothetical protein
MRDLHVVYREGKREARRLARHEIDSGRAERLARPALDRHPFGGKPVAARSVEAADAGLEIKRRLRRIDRGERGAAAHEFVAICRFPAGLVVRRFWPHRAVELKIVAAAGEMEPIDFDLAGAGDERGVYRRAAGEDATRAEVES